MTFPQLPSVAPASRPEARRPEDIPARERLRIVSAASNLSDEELGAFLRREGIHEAQLTEWRQAAVDALEPATRSKAKNTLDARRVRELEKELRRKEKALAEAAALLVLRKKLNALWAAEDDDTKDGNET